MSSRRISRKSLLRGCTEPGPGDGHDPRLDRPDPDEGPGGRKTLQLCGQVARTLSQALADLGDDVLRDLTVVSVSPARGKGRLLVTLAPSPSAPPRDPGEWLDHVRRAHGLLRHEVAAAVHRRKVPDLVFRLAIE